MSPSLMREVLRLGGRLDDSFVPDPHSEVHAEHQHFARVDWGGASFDFYDGPSDPRPRMWLITFGPFGKVDGALQIAHADGGNYTLFLEDAAKEGSEIGIFDHDGGVDEGHILTRSLRHLLRGAVPTGSRRPAVEAAVPIPPMPTSPPLAPQRPAWVVPKGARLVPYPLPFYPHAFTACAVAPDRTTWVSLGTEHECKGWHREGPGWAPLCQGRTVLRIRPLVGGNGIAVDKAYQFATHTPAGMLLVRHQDTIAEVDLATGAYTGRRGPPGLRPLWAQPLPDGRVLVGCEADLVFLEPGLSPIRAFRLPFRPDIHRMSRNGSVVGLAHHGSSAVHVLDLESARVQAALEVHQSHRFAVAPDGSEVAVAAGDGWIYLCDATDGAVRSKLRASDGAFDVAWSPDGTRLLTSGFCAPRETGLEVWDRATLERVHDRRGEGAGELSVVGLATFSLDGEWLLTCDRPREARAGDADPRVLLWPTAEMGLRPGPTSR